MGDKLITKESCKKQNKNLSECYGRDCSNEQFYKCFPDDAPLFVNTVLKIRVKKRET